MAHQTRPSGVMILVLVLMDNNESQSYTNAADNVIVSGGNLKITAKKSRKLYFGKT
jgi:hypothetical protein